MQCDKNDYRGVLAGLQPDRKGAGAVDCLRGQLMHCVHCGTGLESTMRYLKPARGKTIREKLNATFG